VTDENSLNLLECRNVDEDRVRTGIGLTRPYEGTNIELVFEDQIDITATDRLITGFQPDLLS
jgi:hypothetical protein